MNKPAPQVYLALDTAYQQGVVVLFSDTKLLYSQTLTTRYAHGNELAPAIKRAMEVIEDRGFSIAGICAGLGPGSFVGVRLALACALGYSFAASIPLMGFCSHRALALSVQKNLAHFLLVMKASGELYYVSEYEQNQAISPFLSPIKDLVINGPADIFTDQPHALMHHAQHHRVQHLLGPTPEGVMLAARTVLAQGLVDQSAFIKPNYTKPPSVSVSSKIMPAKR